MQLLLVLHVDIRDFFQLTFSAEEHVSLQILQYEDASATSSNVRSISNGNESAIPRIAIYLSITHSFDACNDTEYIQYSHPHIQRAKLPEHVQIAETSTERTLI